jgi:hypothetical protein
MRTVAALGGIWEIVSCASPVRARARRLRKVVLSTLAQIFGQALDSLPSGWLVAPGQIPGLADLPLLTSTVDPGGCTVATGRAKVAGRRTAGGDVG